MQSIGKSAWFFSVFLLIVSGFLFLSNLGNQFLWQDEAEVALVSKTILTQGVPMMTDGINHFSQFMGRDADTEGRMLELAWLPLYVTALSFKTLGAGTFSARLPFALFGMATVLLLYFFSSSFWGNKKCGVLSAVLLLFCVSFIVLARQSRYYAPSAFFSLWALSAYWGLLSGKKRSGLFLFISVLFLFHTHYIFSAALGLSLLTHAFLFHRKALKSTALIFVSVVIVNLPWIIRLSRFSLAENYGPSLFRRSRIFLFLKIHLLNVEQFIIPFWMALGLLIVAGAYILILKKNPIGSREMLSRMTLLGLYCFIHAAVMAVFGFGDMFRYLTPLIPVFYLLLGGLLGFLMEINFILGVAFSVLLIVRQPLAAYFYELTHDFDGPAEGISKYLNAHARAGDLVVAAGGDLPVKFYTGLKVLGGRTGRERLTDIHDPDWIVMRRCWGDDEDYNVKDYLEKNIDWEKYEKITLDYPDTCYENREDPREHRFKTAEGEERVVLYHRKR